MAVEAPPDQPPGMPDHAWARALQVDGENLCGRGDHAWTPWLELPSGSFVTVCGRSGCHAEQKYDIG